jgi:hypothetical protein
MTKGAIAGVVLAGGLAVAALGAQSASSRRTRQELEEVRARLERVEARQKEPAVRPQAVEELQAELARVDAKAARAVEAAAASSTRPGALPAFVTEEDLQKIVDERLETKLQASGGAKPANGAASGDRKMPLHDMAKELGLDEKTQARVAEVANLCKKDIFDVAKTPRADGRSLVDDLLQAMLGGDPAQTQQVFQRLFTDKVPGSDTTYLVAIGSIQDRARQNLKGLLGETTYTRYQHMSVTPDHIETGFDPFAEYVKEKGIDPSTFGAPKK